MNLDYDPEELPLVEELLLAALNGGSENGTRAPILDVLGFGCYVARSCAAALDVSWCSTGHWSEGLTIEFPNVTADPVGKAHAFLQSGPEDSLAYYVSYPLEERLSQARVRRAAQNAAGTNEHRLGGARSRYPKCRTGSKNGTRTVEE